MALSIALRTREDIDDGVVDGALTEDNVFSEGAEMPRMVPSEFSDASEGAALTVVVREANERRDSGEGRRAGYVSTEVVSKADERELDIVLARELARVASLERFAGCGREGKSFLGGGGGTSLAFDKESGISGIVSTGGTETLGARNLGPSADTSDPVSEERADGAES